jgi:hypothetical protein
MKRCVTKKAITTDLVELFACILITSPLLGQALVRRPRILGISHVAFDVSNLSKARTFYGDFLGFEEYGVLRLKTGSVQMAFIKINDFQHLELFVAQPPPGKGRLNHVAFYTENPEQMREYLASRGVQVPARVGRAGLGT